MGGYPEVLNPSGGRAADAAGLAERKRPIFRGNPKQSAYALEQTTRRRAFDERREIVLSPFPDVVFHQMFEHRRVALAAFLQRHLQSALQRRGHGIGFMRIDDQSAGE